MRVVTGCFARTVGIRHYIPFVSTVRILFFADTHLGFDLPGRPRIRRRRRGDDFFANYELILQAAVRGGFDLVVHGGDLFFRSRVPPELVQRAFLPLKRVADRGVPIFIVPGNHERSRIPYDMLARHERLNIFDRPRRFIIDIGGTTVTLAGFPYHHNNVRGEFRSLLSTTGWTEERTDVNLLCVHHCFEGATVGPSGYVFRYNEDVIRHGDVPAEFAAVLTGHVHRHQILTRDLQGRRLRTPVLYPGSIERTSYAEQDEPKGYLELELEPDAPPSAQITSLRFVELPARPMVTKSIDGTGVAAASLEELLVSAIRRAPEDAVLRLRISGTLDGEARRIVSAPHLRLLAPETMNVEAVLVDMRPRSAQQLRQAGSGSSG
jgi:DNA repair exonuclease SbcCD nuclease subunit